MDSLFQDEAKTSLVDKITIFYRDNPDFKILTLIRSGVFNLLLIQYGGIPIFR